MIKLTETQAVAIRALAGKLREKTSVIGYILAVLGLFGVNNPGLAENIAGGVALGASLLFLLFNDATVLSWIVVSAPKPAEAMEPEPVQITSTAAEAANDEVMSMSLTSVASNVFAKVQAAAALLPLVTAMVQTVEATLPPGTPGATKLKAVEDAVASVYEKEQLAQTSFAEVWPLLSGVASTLVTTLKATGVFTSATTKPSA